MSSEVAEAKLFIRADDACEVFLNGSRVGKTEAWNHAEVFDVGKTLRPGSNLLAVRAENQPAPTKNPAGLIACLTLNLADGKQVFVASDDSWRVTKQKLPRWEQTAFDDSGWKKAIVAAPCGALSLAA